MPNYSYKDTKSKKYVNMSMSISEMVEFEKNNPHMERQYTNMTIGDAVKLGIKRPPADFQKGVLARIKEAHPKGKVENRWNITKEI